MSRTDISPILATFGSWVVTTYGIENLYRPYPIHKSRLWEGPESGESVYDDWVVHLRGKRWFTDLANFEAALAEARRIHQNARPKIARGLR